MNKTERAAIAKQRRIRYSPPGYDWDQERSITHLAYIAAILVSSLWLLATLVSQFELITAVEKNRPYVGDLSYLIFTPTNMLGRSLCVWILPIFLSLWNMLVRYRYHFLEGKPIYTMKRLGNHYELPLRCLAIPAMEILRSFLTMILILVIFCLCFRMAIPQKYVPEGSYPEVLRQAWHWWHFT